MLLRWFVAAVFLCLLCGVGGCAQRMTVQGDRDQIYAEAKGALESEGFQTMRCGGHVLGGKGCNREEGRLQFLYYTDTVVPTVVEVRIAAAEEPQERTAMEQEGAGRDAAGAGAGRGDASLASQMHSVEVSAWSSLTYAPDPWIVDLAMGALRRAYLISGHTR